MKTITFKTLSILLAAVLLVAALPIVAFAEIVSPIDEDLCDHNCKWRYLKLYESDSDEYHTVTRFRDYYCTLCEEILDRQEIAVYDEDHNYGDAIDPEIDMNGTCIDCGREVSW